MKKLIGIAALMLAFSPLTHAQGKNDALSRHPDARNDRQSSEMHDRAPVQRARMHHVKHHRVVKHHRKIVHHRTS